jgi:hypothetical protein
VPFGLLRCLRGFGARIGLPQGVHPVLMVQCLWGVPAFGRATGSSNFRGGRMAIQRDSGSLTGG